MKQRIILTEDFIQDAVIKYLDGKGWSKCLNSAELWEQGVDIKVRNNKVGRYWLVEVKGDPKIKVKSPAGSRSSSFNSTYFRGMVMRKVPFNVLRRLCLYIFFVDKNKKVEEINWRELKKIQKETLAVK